MQARGFRPRVAVLDLGMPVHDGYEIARRLKASSAASASALVALSGFGREEDVEHCRRAGFARHMTKPVDPRALHEALTGLLAEQPAAASPS